MTPLVLLHVTAYAQYHQRSPNFGGLRVDIHAGTCLVFSIEHSQTCYEVERAIAWGRRVAFNNVCL